MRVGWLPPRSIDISRPVKSPTAADAVAADAVAADAVAAADGCRSAGIDAGASATCLTSAGNAALTHAIGGTVSSITFITDQRWLLWSAIEITPACLSIYDIVNSQLWWSCYEFTIPVSRVWFTFDNNGIDSTINQYILMMLSASYRQLNASEIAVFNSTERCILTLFSVNTTMNMWWRNWPWLELITNASESWNRGSSIELIEVTGRANHISATGRCPMESGRSNPGDGYNSMKSC